MAKDPSRTLKEVVETRLAELNRNPFEAARLGELERGFVNDILQGKKLSVRGANLSKLAKGLDWSVSELLSEPDGASDKTPPRPAPGRQLLPIRHTVAAGAWHARDELAQEEAEPQLHPAIEDPRYVGIPQWLERVQGDSYNRKAPEGALVHVVDAISSHYQPRHGDTVIVVRSRAQGAFSERTLKQVEIDRGEIALWPRSHNPKWSEPIRYADGLTDPDFDEVSIVGFVIQAYIGFEDDAWNA